MLREFPSKGGTYTVSTSSCKRYVLLGQSAVVPAVAGNVCVRIADTIDLVYKLVLHKKMAR